MNINIRHSNWGYGTGVVDANEHRYTAHDAGPLSLELVRFSKVTVNTGVQ